MKIFSKDVQTTVKRSNPGTLKMSGYASSRKDHRVESSRSGVHFKLFNTNMPQKNDPREKEAF